MSVTAAGRAPAKNTEVNFERHENLALYTITYLAVTAILAAIGSIPTERQEQFVNTLSGVPAAAKPIDLKIKANGKGYVVTDGRYEMFLLPQGNVTPAKTEKVIEALRGNVKVARAGTT